MKKGLFFALLVSMFSLAITGCGAIDDVLDTFVNNSKLTVEMDYHHQDYLNSNYAGSEVNYRDFKITYGDQEYSALGTYQVPNNTVVHMSWSYQCEYYSCGNSKWKTASTDISVGSFETIRVVIRCDEVSVE